MVWEVETGGDGALLVQRAHLPHYRATVDGQDAPIHVANLSRMAIRLGPGRHTVELRIDRSWFHLGLVLAAIALAVLLALSRGGRPAEWLGFQPVKGDAV